MDQIEKAEEDYSELNTLLGPLLSEELLKMAADRVIGAATELRTSSIERALAVGMGLPGAEGAEIDSLAPVEASLLAELKALVALLVPARLKSVADEIIAASLRLRTTGIERAMGLGAQIGAGGAFLIFEHEGDLELESEYNEAEWSW